MPSPTHVLITGAQGQLGQSFSYLHELAEQEHRVTLLGHQELDITDAHSIAQALDQHRPDILINAAAYTAVDRAESEPERAYLVNGTGPGLVAQACARSGTQLIHVSTDYVFDGQSEQAYAENAPTSPVSVYGHSKLAGEQRVLEALPEAVILRTSWVFSQFGNNFLKTMLRLGQERPELRIVADQFGGPSYAVHIAQVLLALASRMQTSTAPATLAAAAPATSTDRPVGIYHFAGDPIVSWYEFAQEIFKQAQEHGLIQNAPRLTPISTSQYPTPACRPAQSGLQQDRLNALLGDDQIARSWRQGIKQSLLHLQTPAS